MKNISFRLKSIFWAFVFSISLSPVVSLGSGSGDITALTQEDLKVKEAQRIREFIQDRNLSLIEIAINLEDYENRFYGELGERRSAQIDIKYQRVIDSLNGIEFVVLQNVNEMGSAVLEVSPLGFEVLANHPDVETLSSPTLELDEIQKGGGTRIPKFIDAPPGDI